MSPWQGKLNETSPTLQNHIEKKESRIKKSLEQQLALAFPEESKKQNLLKKKTLSLQESNISQISENLKEQGKENAAKKIE